MVDRINGFFRAVPVWLIYVIYLLPAPWFFYLAATGQMGIEPITALEHEYGEIALQLLIIGLAITPLRRFAGVNLLKFRRAVGLCAFTYVALHLGVWAVLDVQALDRVWADIVKRPYITIGMAAFVVMLPLALTSNNLSVRKLGPKWRTLHKATYAVAVLGALHFLMLAKGIQLEPLLYMAVILGLLALRAIPRRRTSRATRAA
jgi:sulfoxide reductase heme-binding subunit YedZ